MIYPVLYDYRIAITAFFGGFVKALVQEISSIQVGYTFRDGVAINPLGDTFVLQMKDLAQGSPVEVSALSRIQFGEIREQHGLQDGDVVFRSRGPNPSCTLLLGCPNRFILAGPLYRIRVTSEFVLPGYLAWYLNQQPAQTYLAGVSEGTLQKMVSKNSLLEMPIEFPDLEMQRRILEIEDLLTRESRLTCEILSKKRKLVNSCLAKALQEQEI